MIERNSYIVQQTYLPEDERWYVHEICFLDQGRFSSKEAAEEFKEYLVEKYCAI
jgi:hypothetical protein